MGNRHAPANRHITGWAWAHGNRSGLGLPSRYRTGHFRLGRSLLETLSDPMLYLVTAMIAFVLAVDAYVMVHTM